MNDDPGYLYLSGYGHFHRSGHIHLPCHLDLAGLDSDPSDRHFSRYFHSPGDFHPLSNWHLNRDWDFDGNLEFHSLHFGGASNRHQSDSETSCDRRNYNA